MQKRTITEQIKRSGGRTGFAARAVSVALLAAILFISGIIYLNRIVIGASGDRIITETEALSLKDVDCILILGAGVYANKYPSAMLEDRLAEGVSLYKLGVSNRLLMTGDNSRVDYNEVKVMKDFAVKSGVPPEHVFQDHAGFSTYESLYRARDVFTARKIIIVTQNYHIYRALYIARSLGLDAYGVCADPRAYAGQAFRECREVLARAKDVFGCIFRLQPTYLGDVIPVDGNGNMTD
jgi:vancomycin permeability regulator SanA